MKRITTRISKKISLLFFGDVLLLYAALWVTLALRYGPDERGRLIGLHILPFTLVFALWLMVIGAVGLYELRLLKNEKLFLYRLLQAMAANVVLAIILFYFFPFAIEPRRNLLLIASMAAVFFFLWRSLFNIIIPRAPASRVMFLGANEETAHLADFLLANPQLGWRPVGFISHEEENKGDLIHSLPALPHLVLGPDGLRHIIRDFKPEVIVLSPEMKANTAVIQALFDAIRIGVSTVEFPAFHEMLTGKVPHSLISEAWFLENLIGAHRRSYEVGKRALDLILAFIVSLPALVTFPIIALAIRYDSPGPVFFRQKRVGRNGREFSLLKYRSMVQNADQMSAFKHTEKDMRQTRVGALLRKNYLDELPQIINIFRGEMSFVGPRPERPEFVAELKEKIPFYEMRLLASPGMTGWAQIRMENDASIEDAPQKMQYDLYYVKNQSLTLDLLIMLRTLFILIRREGR